MILVIYIELIEVEVEALNLARKVIKWVALQRNDLIFFALFLNVNTTSPFA